MTGDPLLLDAPSEHVRVITLNRSDARNAITTAMQHELDALLCALRTDDRVRAVVLTGAGDQAFSAGYDIRELGGFDVDAMLANYEERRALVWNVAAFPKPLIGAIRGSAHGAGAILAVALDIRVGCTQTDFRFTAAAYNGVNNTWHLPRVVGLARALEYTMTARRVYGEEALAAGLLNHLTEPGQILPKAIAIADQIAAHPPAGVQWHKALIRANVDRSLADAYAAENEIMTTVMRPERPDQIFGGFLGKKPRG
ncbi:MAG: enoyl-CoA hydratase/isomerase family protein [Panacagrimonas sp.]